MQRTRGRRCQVPIRTRRRQSDAKWRASVASCYETLRFVIPSGNTISKRKASKSFILQETEKHIGNLERAISSLLSTEVQEQGQGVLWRKGEHWTPATLEDLQNDFTKQQGKIFQQSSQGRRCYNMLHDIQDDIINMEVDSKRLAFLPLPAASANPGPDTDSQDATASTRKHKMSKARMGYETDQAKQRILSAYDPGDIVNAVIPTPMSVFPSATATSTSDTLQAVPNTPTSHSSLHPGLCNGRNIRLQRVDEGFVCMDSGPLNSLTGLDRMLMTRPTPARETRTQQRVQVQHQAMHEVPEPMTPNKVYGIARHDVMMSQDGEVPHMLAASGTTAGMSPSAVPTVNHILIKKEVDTDCKTQPVHSSICKKLDFRSLESESMYEHSGFQTMSGTPYLSSLVCSTSTGFTPIKGQVTYSSGLISTIKQELVTSPESGINSSGSFSIGISGMGSIGNSSGNLSGSHLLMTPVKLAGSDPCMTDMALFSPSSAWALGNAMDARVPQAGGLSDMEELGEMDQDHGLLCMENFDMDNEFANTLPQEKTPRNVASSSKPKHECKKRGSCKKKGHTKPCKHTCSHRPSPQCKKRLEGLYEKLPADGTKDMDHQLQSPGHFEHTECSEFDGYLLYYQQVVPGLKKKLGNAHDADSLEALVSDMWARLPWDDRRTMVMLATLENQDSNSSSAGSNSLSQDLEDVKVTPLHDTTHFHDNPHSSNFHGNTQFHDNTQFLY